MKNKCLFVLLIGALIWCAFQPPLSGSYDCASLLGLGIGLGSSLIGGAIDYIAQDEQNSANASMSREQMNWQSGENALDRDFQREMVNYQLRQAWQYKDPAFLRKAYENAGFNPSFALNGIAGGSGISAGSAPSHSVGGVQLPNYQAPVGAFGSTLQNALSILSQLTAIEGAQIDNKNKQALFDTQFGLWRAQAENYQKLSNVYEKQSGNLFLDWLRKSKTLESNVQGDFAENLKRTIEVDSARQIVTGLALDNKMKEIDLQFRSALNEQQLAQLKALTSQAYAAAADYNMSVKERSATIDLLGKQADKVVADTKLTEEGTKEAKFWNEFRRSFKPEIFHNELEKSASQIGLNYSQIERTDALNNPVQNFSPLLIGAGAAGLGAVGRFAPSPARIGFKHY